MFDSNIADKIKSTFGAVKSGVKFVGSTIFEHGIRSVGERSPLANVFTAKILNNIQSAKGLKELRDKQANEYVNSDVIDPAFKSAVKDNSAKNTSNKKIESEMVSILTKIREMVDKNGKEDTKKSDLYVKYGKFFEDFSVKLKKSQEEIEKKKESSKKSQSPDILGKDSDVLGYLADIEANTAASAEYLETIKDNLTDENINKPKTVGAAFSAAGTNFVSKIFSDDTVSKYADKTKNLFSGKDKSVKKETLADKVESTNPIAQENKNSEDIINVSSKVNNTIDEIKNPLNPVETPDIIPSKNDIAIKEEIEKLKVLPNKIAIGYDNTKLSTDVLIPGKEPGNDNILPGRVAIGYDNGKLSTNVLAPGKEHSADTIEDVIPKKESKRFTRAPENEITDVEEKFTDITPVKESGAEIVPDKKSDVESVSEIIPTKETISDSTAEKSDIAKEIKPILSKIEVNTRRSRNSNGTNSFGEQPFDNANNTVKGALSKAGGTFVSKVFDDKTLDHFADKTKSFFGVKPKDKEEVSAQKMETTSADIPETPVETQKDSKSDIVTKKNNKPSNALTVIQEVSIETQKDSKSSNTLAIIPETPVETQKDDNALTVIPEKLVKDSDMIVAELKSVNENILKLKDSSEDKIEKGSSRFKKAPENGITDVTEKKKYKSDKGDNNSLLDGAKDKLIEKGLEKLKNTKLGKIAGKGLGRIAPMLSGAASTAVSAASAYAGPAALLTAAGVGGYQLGKHIIAPGIDKAIQGISGNKDDTLGSAVYDVFNRNKEIKDITKPIQLTEKRLSELKAKKDQDIAAVKDKIVPEHNKVFAGSIESVKAAKIEKVETVNKLETKKEDIKELKSSSAGSQTIVVNNSKNGGSGGGGGSTNFIVSPSVRNKESSFERCQMQDFWSRCA